MRFELGILHNIIVYLTIHGYFADYKLIINSKIIFVLYPNTY